MPAHFCMEEWVRELRRNFLVGDARHGRTDRAGCWRGRQRGAQEDAGQRWRLASHQHRLGFRGVRRCEHRQPVRCAHQPGGHHRVAGVRQLGVRLGAGARLHPRPAGRRLHRCRALLAGLQAAVRHARRAGEHPRDLQHRPDRAQLHLEPRDRDHRHLRAGVLDPAEPRRQRRPGLRRRVVRRDRHRRLARWPDRIRHQPGT
jgi:hypothetical protein